MSALFFLGQICDIGNLGQGACDRLRDADAICEAPALVENLLRQAVGEIKKSLEDFLRMFDIDVDFQSYWESRVNQSQSFESIQAAIEQELEDSFSSLNSLLIILAPPFTTLRFV